MNNEQEAWKNASIAASNLSQLELTLGNVESAQLDAEQAMAHANRSGNAFRRMADRTAVADALHQAGCYDEARALFREAEDIQAERQPQYPLLYSLPGFRYCDLLLSEPERAAWRCVIGWQEPASGHGAAEPRDTSPCPDASNRAAQSLTIAERNRWLLDIALDHLTLGRASLYGSIVEAGALLTEPTVGSEPLIDQAAAQYHVDAGVDGFRHGSRSDYLPRGLLTRAWLRFLQGDPAGARADLDEAWEIAERGPMRLFLADIHLYRARLFHAVRPYPWGRPHADLAAARKLIEECGYWRRKEELEDAEEAAKNW